MKTQPMLPSSSGHLLKLTKSPIFTAIILSKQDTSTFSSALGTACSCEQFSAVGKNIGRTSKSFVNFCTRFYYFNYALFV